MDSKLETPGVTGYTKRMDRIACVYVFMFFCAIWWIDGIQDTQEDIIDKVEVDISETKLDQGAGMDSKPKSARVNSTL